MQHNFSTLRMLSYNNNHYVDVHVLDLLLMCYPDTHWMDFLLHQSVSHQMQMSCTVIASKGINNIICTIKISDVPMYIQVTATTRQSWGNLLAHTLC